MSFEKFQRKDDDDDKEKTVRSNYFQTEFSITFNKRKDDKTCSSSSSLSLPEEKFDGSQQQRKKHISVQVSRNIVGQEEIPPKERKKWIRPPLVGQASTSTDVVVPAHQETQSDSEDDIIESSQPTVEPTVFTSRIDYKNRKDYISEKPPEGGSADQGTSPNTNNQGDYVKSASPTSSVTSSRPLEWDSGADVGYFQFYSGQAKDAELSTLERLALERGSASLLTRSDPEGTTCSTIKQLPNIPVGRPNAESTPVNTLNKKKEDGSENQDYYPLFPEVIVEEHGQVSDSDVDANNVGNLQVKKSSSLEIMPELKSDDGPATFPRSQSQSSMVFNINTHLQKMLANTKSNSSSSVATVVTGKKKLVQNSPENEETGDRANSFEYLPGHVYENKSNEMLFVDGQDFKRDVERGVQLMTEFVKGSNANNTLLKKELLHRVVEGLISAEYLSDNDWSPYLQRCVTRRSHNRDISGESSIADNLNQNLLNKRTIKDSSTGPSPISSNSRTNVSYQNSSESRNSESHFGQLQNIGGQKFLKSSLKTMKENEPQKSNKSSSDLSKTSSDWKQPITKSEKFFEAKKVRGDIAPIDSKLLHYLYSERENQIDWIKKEINHLSNLKQLLEKHENLRRNFAIFKKNKQKSFSAEAARSGRYFRRKEMTTATQSEPAFVSKNGLIRHKENENNSESDYNSHNYDTDRGDGILRRHASTDTRDWKVNNGWQTFSNDPKKPLAYTITFEPNKGKENVNYKPQEDGKRIIEGGAVTDRETLMKLSRHRVKEQFSKLSLQDELLSKRPDLIAKAEGRRQIVAELTALRELRQQHKTNILAAAVSESDQPVPPHPLALKRVLSQKAMRNLTEKKYKQTFEVKKRQLDMKRKEDYRTNRLMAEVFKKKLQKRTLQGKTDLSNSINIISSI